MIDRETAELIYRGWKQQGKTYDELAAQYGLDRGAVRRIVVNQQIEHGPGVEVAPVGGTDGGDDVVDGELVSESAAYLPAHYQGDGPPPGAPQDVIDNWLTPSARRLILRGKSEHTIRAYLKAFGWWVRFAKANKITVMPAPQNGMIRMLDWWETFPVHVGCTGRKQQNGEPCSGHRPSPSAVWIWFSAMKWFHGIGEPPMPWEGGVKLTSAIAGYITQMKDEGWRVTRAPRAFPDDVRLMVDALDAMGEVAPPGWKLSEDPEDDDAPVWFAPARRDMLRALVLCTFYTGGRASDLARYRLNDMERFPPSPPVGDQPGTPGGLQLTLARSKSSRRDSKNEEFRTIFHDVEHPQYDGVLAVERWVAQLNAAGIFHGALIRPVHKSGTIVRGEPDALAYRADVTGLSRAVKWVAKAAWQLSGKELVKNWRDYTIHSLRRGRVQQLLEAGVDVYDVEEALGWAHGGAIKSYRAEVTRQSRGAANAHGML